ncbi:MAG: putative M18 family aminopeptidase 2 [bacterium ADurb.BinA028]|nr:MAG: putative M18 family aminopeptidase 2 [bacterium ADurb.BinA028]
MSLHTAFDPDSTAQGLIDFVDASPTPFHAVDSAIRLLAAEGFTALDESAPFPSQPGRYYIARGGALVAWIETGGMPPTAPFRVIGTHTDSPNLRVKPRPDLVKAGWQMVAVEPYGGLLINSWLDRDLGLAGRVAVRDDSAATGVSTRLFHDRAPLLRVAQLAIHLDRGVNERGLVLNPQQHLVPLWGVGEAPASVAAYLGEQVGADPGDVLAWDAMLHDTQPSARIGRAQELIAAPRLDNLASSYAAVRALLAVAASGGTSADQGADAAYRPVIALFDHEEVGSRSERGADSPMLRGILERIVLAAGGSRDDLWRALAGTIVASADMAHATHPNYSELHEPGHRIEMNGGPVLKVQTELRYATDAVGAAALHLACEQADVPLQVFVTRSDLPCGSTIGPITAGQVGVTTVDLGAPMLSMHSIRELAGVADQAMYAAALAAFLAPVP